jgi:hypothetical protein
MSTSLVRRAKQEIPTTLFQPRDRFPAFTLNPPGETDLPEASAGHLPKDVVGLPRCSGKDATRQ